MFCVVQTNIADHMLSQISSRGKSLVKTTVDVAALSVTQLDKIHSQLLAVQEVSCCLVFRDGSTQLRELPGKKVSETIV